MDQKWLTPILVSALLVWAIYRRLRRSFGRQPLHSGRMQFRIAILALVGTLALVACARNAALLAALIGGAIAGVALGYIGLQHTKVEVTPQGRYYTPHTYIGLIVSALFLGRVAFRLLSVYLPAQAAGYPGPNPFDSYQKSPLTLAIFGVLVGYYIFLSVGVLRKSRDLALPAAATPQSPET